GFGWPTLEPLITAGLLIICASVLAFAGLSPDAHFDFGGVIGTWEGNVLAGFFGFWGALVLLLATIAIGVAVVSDLEALGALLSENVLSLWGRIGAKKNGGTFSDEEDFAVVGVPETDDEEYEDDNDEEVDVEPTQR